MELDKFVAQKRKQLGRAEIDKAKAESRISKLTAEIDNAETAHASYLRKRQKNQRFKNSNSESTVPVEAVTEVVEVKKNNSSDEWLNDL